jgi:uncharacterized membrane protein
MSLIVGMPPTWGFHLHEKRWVKIKRKKKKPFNLWNSEKVITF